MCLCVFALHQHPKYKLALVFNRDEFLMRPTKEAHYWNDHPYILAGRDMQEGGTWLGITKTGKIAFLTNYRDLRGLKEHAPTRGNLTLNFLSGEESGKSYLEHLEHPEDYNGFNLMVGNQDQLFWYSNKGEGIVPIKKGLYGISNHLLDSPWDKVLRKKQEFKMLLKNDDLKDDDLFSMMYDTAEANEENLPDTGVPPELEKKLSAGFIILPDYGTISTTVILIDYYNLVRFREKRFSQGGELLHDAKFVFRLNTA
jgi:uncharacterized protein with NRDE domain